MKAMLERHAARLAPGERRAIWENVERSRAGESRAWWRWTPPAPAASAVAAVAAAVFVFAVLQREPARFPPARPGAPAEVARDAAGAAPRADGARAEAPRAPSAVPGGEAQRSRAAERTGAAIAAPPPPVVATLPVPVPAATGVPPAAAFAPTGVVTGRITDEHGQPVPFANVLVLGTRAGALSAEDGSYVIAGVPSGTHSLKALMLGYEPVTAEGVRVEDGKSAVADLRLGEQRIVKQLESIRVSAEKRIETKSSTTKASLSAEKVRQIPVDNLPEVIATRAGIVAQGGELHMRGGRGDATAYRFDGVEAAPAPPPVIPITGGTRLPNDEAFDSMFFKNHGVNPFVATDEDPFSTFAVDVDAASYTVTRRYLELGHLPPADAVRLEEFVNFFRQDYPPPAGGDFRLVAEGAPSPFGRGYHLLRIGLKGREVSAWQRRPAQLTFVIDVSGSMQREDRLELVKRALRLLVAELRDGDRVGIVVYGTQGRVLLEPVAVGEGPAESAEERRDSADPQGGAVAEGDDGRARVLAAIERLRPEGSTNAEDGLRLGYEMARRGFRPGATNRIVLCSDGVANVGSTGPESILAQVRTEADRGIHLTTIGFGMGNYNDVLMEQLADRGDGNHYYVDDLGEARRVFVDNLAGTLQVIAKDAKVQVEFDSTRVLRYRLLGFENRDVADRDFRNDRVDAGEIGAGHEVTALYEVKLAPRAARGTLATVRLRYARPEQEGGGAPQVREIERRIDVGALDRRFADAAPRFRLDAAVAEFAEILRGSYWAKDSRLSDVLSVARGAAADLSDDAVAEFVALVEKAADLRAKAAKQAGRTQR